ncbi:MAG: MOSC domain-containing protein [bacterium]|nr:MOSC domain-containing protein [bacterium]
MVEVAALQVYPVKSCAGIAYEQVVLDARGFAHDRGWMIVDGHDEFVTQREHPRLALITPQLDAGMLHLTTPEGQTLAVPTAGSSGPTRHVRVWRDRCEAVDQGNEAAQFFSDWLGESVRLVKMADDYKRQVNPDYTQTPAITGFSDGFPLLLISEASLGDLNSRLASPLPMNRFRPNLVVKGCGRFAEDGWQQLKIGSIVFDVAKSCDRCAVTTTDQTTGARGVEPLRTLATYRRAGAKVYFGQNIIHRAEGTIAVGTPVEVVPRVR